MRYQRKTAAERRAEAQAHNRRMDELNEKWMKLPLRPYRDAYRPGRAVWGFEAGLMKTRDGRYRLGYVTVQSLGARDWDGSSYSTTLAHFEKVDGGWLYKETVYPTLLRAVRVYYTPEERARRLRCLAAHKG